MNYAPLPPERLETLVSLLPDVKSLRDLANVMGLNIEHARHAAAPFLAIMKVQGTHPKCSCGKDRFHPYGCIDGYAKSPNGMPGVAPDQYDRVRGIRQATIEMLIAGHRFCDIDATMGRSIGVSRRMMRFLTPDQRAARDAAIQHQKGALK